MDFDIKKPVRKYNRKNPLENNRKLMRFAKESSRNAIDGLLDSGIDVVYIKDGVLVKESPSRKVSIIRGAKEAEKKFNLKEYLCQG